MSYAIQEQVENELDILEKHGVTNKTDRSCWGCSIVVGPKAVNTGRIFGDYKSTIIQSLEDKQ